MSLNSPDCCNKFIFRRQYPVFREDRESSASNAACSIVEVKGYAIEVMKLISI
jgi:hypothetical protein